MYAEIRERFGLVASKTCSIIQSIKFLGEETDISYRGKRSLNTLCKLVKLIQQVVLIVFSTGHIVRIPWRGFELRT